MPRFMPLNYQQHSMVVINYLDQLQAGTFEYAIHYLIEEKLDLSVFYPKYKNDATGRLAYDPAALLKIVLFAYSKGITSSREIQWCCETNIIFKALSCDSVPHFTTKAAFISVHKDEIVSVFEPLFGNIGANKRLNRISLRGKDKGARTVALVLFDTQHRKTTSLRAVSNIN
ncbi:transposase [Agaribacter flavus]|uniref:Transposase n=1 Tax=Agaribacter flavus TaxID=1902781 RepID=A0ABV7FK93_9ALTE